MSHKKPPQIDWYRLTGVDNPLDQKKYKCVICNWKSSSLSKMKNHCVYLHYDKEAFIEL